MLAWVMIIDELPLCKCLVFQQMFWQALAIKESMQPWKTNQLIQLLVY
jgi:hypothetical protein